MWLSCTENPPPYGLAVAIKNKGTTYTIPRKYIRRRDRQYVEREDFTDYWCPEETPTSKNRPEVMAEYEWEVSEHHCDEYEVYEDD